MMKINASKQKVLEAASSLFFQKGFHGTSVRDIADRASVNVSLISYYFKGKQGLLEYAVTQYYENYLTVIEETMESVNTLPPLEQLKELIFHIIQYKQSNHQLSCFIQRELSLDSVFVREMAVTYLAKENHYIRNLLFTLIKDQKKNEDDQNYLLMQLKGMLITPYIMHNEWKNQVIGTYSHTVFVNKYVRNIQQWLDFLAKENINNTNEIS